ncbi:hypothetical protein [Thalassobacillus pellis]|uniref:hypothetical protein n=1 Tax=Thalassobacillus pellis TaxID=748008 RepID=UPI00196228CA|nr:hypothetical protein [Thalassobacillus pellis]MBM7554242.1 hypothetical protein [Thalassobacillus pellis]
MKEKKTKRAKVHTSNEQAEVFSRGVSFNKSFIPQKPDSEDHLTEGELMYRSLETDYKDNN